MSTVDSKGSGHFEEAYYVKLMENHGFRVDDAKTKTLKYMLKKEFMDNFITSTVMTSFPELTGANRDHFFKEYIDRIKERIYPVGHLLS